MTKEQLLAEMLYHAGVSPFRQMVMERLISDEDFMTIDTILRVQYSPVFVEKVINLPLDIKENQR